MNKNDFREKALKDYNTQISSAEERGRKAGEEIGQKIGLKLGEQRARQVFKLHIQGKTPEEIAALCNLTIDKVNEILE